MTGEGLTNRRSAGNYLNMGNNHELTSIDDLIAAPYNPREISASAEDGLGESIARFGDISGIVWNKTTGHIVSGHQRVKQLRKLGGQLLDGAIQVNSGERFKIRVVEWTELEEKAANVAANNAAIAGIYTEDVNGLLDEIEAGIGKDDFDSLLLNKVDVPIAAPICESDVPRLDEKSTVICPGCGNEFTP